MPQLDLEDIASALKSLEGWEFENDAIAKEWTFENFREAIAFTNTVADMANEADHHPDIAINYNHVRLTLSTHSEGGVTEKDVALARTIEAAGIGARERREKRDRRAEERREAERRRLERRDGERRG
jgi:4a-hydroxytetrahydrobiopterin dehydratase